MLGALAQASTGRAKVSPEFISTRFGRVLLTRFFPPDQSDHLIIYLPPFLDEMNKSRRACAVSFRAFAELGFTVWVPDYPGTGDSEGEPHDFSVSDWLNCLLEWLANLQAKSIYLMGLRSGALLIPSLLKRWPPGLPAPRLLVWQPVLSGALQVNQWRRLAKVGAMVRASDQGESGANLAATSFGGYDLCEEFLDELQGLAFTPGECGFDLSPMQMCWLEARQGDRETLAPASNQCIARWQSLGWSVSSLVISTPPFWLATETEESPNMLAESLSWLTSQIGSTHE